MHSLAMPPEAIRPEAMRPEAIRARSLQTFFAHTFLLIGAFLFSSCVNQRSAIDRDAPIPSRAPSQIVGESNADDWLELDPEYTLYLEVPDGRIVVALSKHLGQNHVTQIKTLARSGYYDGLKFYRVIEGFVAQAGSQGEGRSLGSAADSLISEFEEIVPASLPFVPLGNEDGYADQAGFIDGLPAARDVDDNTVWLTHCTGAMAYARGNRPNSAAATIYITLQPHRYLDRNLTVVGRVVWGMEHVQSISRALPEEGGIIADEARQTPIVSMRVAADVPGPERTNLEIFNTSSPTFKTLVESRRNRPGDFWVYRPNYIDLCQLPMPVRLVP